MTHQEADIAVGDHVTASVKDTQFGSYIIIGVVRKSIIAADSALWIGPVLITDAQGNLAIGVTVMSHVKAPRGVS